MVYFVIVNVTNDTTMKQLILVVFAAIFALSETVIVQNLGGHSWTAHNENKCKVTLVLFCNYNNYFNLAITIQSRVPGSIYSDLEGNGKIGPIYKDFNDVNSRWVAYDSWSFERHFDGKTSSF